MDVAAPNREPRVGSEPMAPVVIGGGGQRAHLADTYDRVLRLIAREADLAEGTTFTIELPMQQVRTATPGEQP